MDWYLQYRQDRWFDSVTHDYRQENGGRLGTGAARNLWQMIPSVITYVVFVNSYLVGTEEGHIHRCSCSYNEQYLDSYFGHTVCLISWILYVFCED